MGIDNPHSLPPRDARVRKRGLSWNDVNLRRGSPGSLESQRQTGTNPLKCQARHTTIGFGTSGEPSEFSKKGTRDTPRTKEKGLLRSDSMGCLNTNGNGEDGKSRASTRQGSPLKCRTSESMRIALCKAYYTSPTDKNYDCHKFISKLTETHPPQEDQHKKIQKTPRDVLFTGRSKSMPNTLFNRRNTFMSGTAQRTKNDVYQNKRNSMFAKRESTAGNISNAWKILRSKSLLNSSRVNVITELVTDAVEDEKQAAKERARLARRLKNAFRTILIIVKWFSKSRAMRDERAFLEQMKEIDPVSIPTKADSRDDANKTKNPSEGATFFFDDFKANRQMRMPIEARKSLNKPPEERTEQEIYHAMIALRSITQIADFPLRMQKLLAQNGFYECYEPKRIIVREKHRARAFYFILYGSVLVAVSDGVSYYCKTVCRMFRGESFGELAIVHKSPRQSTVISNTEVELLRISTEVYEKLFMCGGKKDLKDPDHYAFINQQIFLRGWPIERLEDDDPDKINFAFFKRGAVLVRDSNYSDWIYVVKSGSLQVLKKLAKRKPAIDMRSGQLIQKRKLTEQDKRRAFQCDQFTGIVDRYKLTFPDPISVREVPDLPNEEEEELKLESEAEEESEVEEETEESGTGSEGSGGHLVRLIDTVKRAQTAIGNFRDGIDADQKKNRHVKSAGPREIERLEKGKKRTFLEDLNEAYHAQDHEVTEADKNPVFVNVQTLTKGQVFGLATIAFEDQPSFILVSNGAECLAINKKFYVENCPPALLRKLKTQVSPFPSQEKLQEDLMTRINWDAYKESLLRQHQTHYTARQKPFTTHL